MKWLIEMKTMIKWWYGRYFRPRPNNTVLHPMMDNRALYNYYPATLPEGYKEENYGGY